jgi:hypothetical protein
VFREEAALSGAKDPRLESTVPKEWRICMAERPLPGAYLESHPEPIVILLRGPECEMSAGDWTQNWCTLSAEARRLGYRLQSIGGAWEGADFVEDPRGFDLVVRGGARDNGRLKGLMRKFVGEGTRVAVIWKDEGQSNAQWMHTDGGNEELGPLTMEMLGRAHARVWGRPDSNFRFDRVWTQRSWIGRLIASRNLTSSSTGEQIA